MPIYATSWLEAMHCYQQLAHVASFLSSMKHSELTVSFFLQQAFLRAESRSAALYCTES
jgi:hypothetical protein